MSVQKMIEEEEMHEKKFEMKNRNKKYKKDYQPVSKCSFSFSKGMYRLWNDKIVLIYHTENDH